METNNYGRKLNSTTYTRDSIDGIYRYIVSYEYRPEDIDEKGRKHGEKMVWRYYTTDYCLYEDHVEYSVFGSIEVAKKISSSYYQRDEKGRLLESGNINYEEVYMDFVQEHPEDFNLNYYSPLFVKAVFEGKVQGQRKADLKCVYDAKGLLLEKQFYGSNCKYKYNDKGEITEVVCDSEFGTSTQQFWYNENGLISKTIHIPNRDVENAENDARECVYNYTYY